MSTASARPAVVLDLDGTLVDSVYQHVVAWQAAFHDVGLHVGAVRIHEAIGMGGDRLVAAVAGDSAETAVGDEVRRLHDTYFEAGLRTICPLDGAPELVDGLVERGHRVVLASSSESGLVDQLLEIVGVGHQLEAVVTGSDEAATKPAPDMVALAIERAGGGPAVVIGDATWDIESAVNAGASSIGLRSGGVSAERLLAAGATTVHAGPRDLLDHLDDAPLGKP
ncbi:HAD family hydrolase [Nocardioides KLBMP 9356]|uniref:HAD family hydrolase n=1 Tax=Nocardioides potassii TaxID=2911371 RepID=A0ABS9HCQ3_9ACTN|nr:HAD family hydrolase [Nocardioides potassii]MCF6377883.1 HAD family hydrolase [Nocardioides potassii]